MSVTINGTTGLAGVDGSAGTPAVQGSDTNTGIFFPAADIVGVTTGGTERMRITSAGDVGIGTASPTSVSGYGALTLGGSTGGLLTLRVGSTDTGYVLATTSEFAFKGTTTAPTTFYTNNTEQARIDSAGLFKFNSGYGSAATAYGCRAWVSFAGATGTRTGSGNVSSVTRNSTGNYTVNFASALIDANYSAVCTTRNGSIAGLSQGTLATSSFTFLTTNVAGSSTDSTDNGVAVFR